jgi:choline kinase
MKKLVDIIILGAKPIKGMKSLGAFSNIKINKYQNILDSQVYNLKKKLNVNNIIYVGGFQSSKIYESKNINIIENNQYDIKNNAFSLKLALQHIESDYVLILFNKILFSHKIFNRFDYDSSTVFINDNDSNTYNIGCILNDNDSIENLFYNLPNKTCGIYGLAKSELDILKSIDINDNFFIFEVINEIISSGGEFRSKYIENPKNIIHIENNNTLKKIKRYYAQNFSL